MGELVTLYRPVGKKEFELIRSSGFAKFPQRLPHQPIFYPVLTEDYARQIARDWNTKDAQSDYTAYVTRFQVRADFLCQFEEKQVGDNRHRELWIPAEMLDKLNQNIVGEIEVIAEFHSPHESVR